MPRKKRKKEWNGREGGWRIGAVGYHTARYYPPPRNYCKKCKKPSTHSPPHPSNSPIEEDGTRHVASTWRPRSVHVASTWRPRGMDLASVLFFFFFLSLIIIIYKQKTKKKFFKKLCGLHAHLVDVLEQVERELGSTLAVIPSRGTPP